MKSTLRRTLLASAMLCVAGVVSTAHAADGDGWDWTVAPYLWASSVGTDVNTSEPPSADLSADTSFSDIVDKLDGAYQIHIEGQGDQFGLFADFTYVGLADENQRERFSTESDLDTRLFELAAVWSPGEERFRGLDVFAGLRYLDVDLTVEVQPVNPAFAPGRIDASKSYSDFMLGARYTFDLSPRWAMTLRGDGSFGDTEGTWNASAVAQYRTQHGAWLLGYRYLNVELGTDENSTEIAMSGPMAGYGRRF